jgi:hypothetical protein
MYKLTIEKWPEDYQYGDDVKDVLKIERLLTSEMVKDLNYMFEDDVLMYVFTQMLHRLRQEEAIKEHGF